MVTYVFKEKIGLFNLLKMIKKSAFCLITSYLMNKYEPPRRQLYQWSRLAHNRLQSASISGGIPVFRSKTD